MSTSSTDEPRYIEPGDEFAEGEVSSKRPKWTYPSTDFQRRVLMAHGSKYYPSGKEGKRLRSELIKIEKAMVPLDELVSIYPEEWVNECLAWFERANVKGFVPFQGFVTLVNDEYRKRRFLSKLGHKTTDYTDPYDG